MSWIQQLRDLYRPTTIACDDSGPDPAAQFDPTYYIGIIVGNLKMSLKLICQ